MYAFVANLGIAIAKILAAIKTGSSSMMAESIHSVADTGNQLLLLLGLSQSKREPDLEHPLGYGKVTFFWSFMVAIILFSLGGLYSLYEGYHKLGNDEPIEDAWIAFTVLGIAVFLEGGSLFGCLKEIEIQRRGRSLMRWLKESRSAELVVVFGEDVGALIGLVLAMCFLGLAVVTGDTRYDAYGSMVIGVILLSIAVFVGVRIQALLIGRSADPELEEAIRDVIREDNAIEELYHLITIQLGPQILLAAKVRLRSGLSCVESCREVNDLERTLKKNYPQIRWSFVETDVVD
ncbi:MAG: cation diffusion facilitator family transporter [Candidatus Paceibacteria bacterium]|jgi:cation diffusion facilitator family transporter